MKLDRRQFVQQSAAAAASVAIAATVQEEAAAEEPPTAAALPIVDTHQHLWDLTKFKLPWVDSVPDLNRSFVTKDYLEAVRGLNVVKAVYMEVDVDPSQQVAEAEHLIEICKQKENLTIAAVISGRPASEAFKPYITQYKGSPIIKGVRQVLHVPETKAGYCLDKNFVQGVRLLGELGMSFDLCMRPTELTDAAKLVDQCPGTRFILDHCGNADPKAFWSARRRAAVGPTDAPTHEPDQWRRDLADLAKRKNIVCKISGIVARAPKGQWIADDLAPPINHCLSEFGPDRVMFGSDWPVCTLAATYRQWVEALRQIINARPVPDQRKLFHDNAVKFYGLA
jgi:L-fuconolactonase